MTERLRDYVIAEGDAGYTIAYAAWDLGVSVAAVSKANRELLKLGIVKEVCPRLAHEGAVFAYNEDIPHPRPKLVTPLFPELDESRRVGELAPVRGKPVSHVRPVGSSGKPAADRRRQRSGAKVKRGRSQGYGGR